MKNFRFSAYLLLLVAAGSLFGTPVRAQVSSSNMTVKQQRVKSRWLKGNVIHADAQQVIVSDPRDPRVIRTFSLSPKVQTRMQKIIGQGGYQYGDKVKVLYTPGNTVAQGLKGKPSKAL